MTITSIGYPGPIGAPEWASLASSLGADYGVVGAGDCRVSTVPAADRTVKITVGSAYGKGIFDVSDDEETIQLDSLVSGTRWDLVGFLRTWDGVDSETTVAKITGTSSQTAVFASRPATPGTSDFQPLALVQITAGNSVPTAVLDLRVWQANGGAVANEILALQYLNSAGTEVWVGQQLFHRYVDNTGALQWSQVDSNLVYDTTFGWIPRVVANYATVTVASGSGSVTVPLGRTVIGSQRYAFTAQNADGTTQSGMNVYATDPVTGSVTSISVRYTGGTSGGARIGIQGTYIG